MVGVALPDSEGGNDLAVRVEGDPCPDISRSDSTFRRGGVLVLFPNESPDLVHFNPGGAQAVHLLVHDPGTGFTNALTKTHDSVTMDAGHALNGADAGTLGEHVHCEDFLFGSEVLGHNEFVADFL